MEKKVELLAPAGSYEVFKAVINAGADAVYLAGSMYGARAYAGNLTDEELLNAVKYSKVHNIRLYLAVNTLLKNTEMDALYDYILPLYEAGLDAVIVQDYGVMMYIHKCFPDMDIHASTQMTVTRPEHAEFLKKYGVTRIVPARELSLKEIEGIYKKTGLEIETFIHGALCYSYSGLCFMSSLIGGRSGNRGRCAQPCRLNYRINGTEGNFLSLKDLCTIDIIPDIIESGVCSLKIEGRMKSAEYAAGVTSIYRKYIDLYLEKGKQGYTTDDSDKDRLLMLFDRGGLTDGYYNRHNGSCMIADTFKSDKNQLEKTEYEKELNNKYVRTDNKIKISCKVLLVKDNPVSVTLSYGRLKAEAQGAIPEKAVNRSITREDIIKQTGKLGNTAFEMDNMEIVMDDGLFVSLKSLNELRRKASDMLSDLMLSKYRRKNAMPYEHKVYAANNTFKGIAVRVLTYGQAEAVLKYNIARLIMETELIGIDELIKISEICHEKGTEIFAAFPRVSRYNHDFFSENMDTIIKNTDGIMIRNIAQKKILDGYSYIKPVISDYTCYSLNDYAAEFLGECGINGNTFPIELNEKELRSLKLKNPELIVYGRLPLMISASCIDRTSEDCHNPFSGFTKLTDRKKAEMPVLACCRYCYNIIYNSVPLYLIDKIKEIKQISPSYIGLTFTDETAGETDIIMNYTIDAVYKDAEHILPLNSYTRGHFTRGVE